MDEVWKIEKNDGLWRKGGFIESADPNDSGKMRTFHMKHDEEMHYDCRMCEKKISAHNKDWHDGLCDECYNDECYPDDEAEPMDKDMEEKLADFDPDRHSVLELCKETGTGLSAIHDANTEAFLPLLLAIEETIWLHYDQDHSLKDKDVIESLKKMRENVFSEDAVFSKMENDIITKIKGVLLLNNFDQRDVSLCISKVLKSAKLHKSIHGSQGYLNFISGYFGRYFG